MNWNHYFKRAIEVGKQDGVTEMVRRGIRVFANEALREPQPAPFQDTDAPDYLAKEEPCAEAPDKTRLRAFKDKHKGERCFIVGNGPSLNKLDLTKLNDEYSFGVNGIFYKTNESGYRPYYYVVEDRHVMADNVRQIDEFKVPGHKFFPTDYRQYLADTTNTSFFRMNRGFYVPNSPNNGIPRFSTDASERLYCGQSVTMINLQLAFYMGFTEVYLIGMDFSYVIPKSAVVEGTSITSTEDDPNHFHPEYFGKGKKWHDPQLDRVLMNYKMCKFNYECAGRRIFNATAGGKLELFDRVDYESLFV